MEVASNVNDDDVITTIVAVSSPRGIMPIAKNTLVNHIANSCTHDDLTEVADDIGRSMRELTVFTA
ncbi:MAG: hypothetical protein H6R24_1447 [Proteobacteria bacterium]|nr:hypothetical protein [Pseudomonadota bacterium]